MLIDVLAATDIVVDADDCCCDVETVEGVAVVKTEVEG